VDDDRIKSAIEIAMERVSDMPELTPEEIDEQKERELRPVGEAIGNRFLQGMIGEKELRAELGKRRGDSGRMAGRACVAVLSGSIQLEDVPAAQRALDGLLELARGRPVFRDGARGAWERILGEFRQREAAVAREFETRAREAFAARGISGSAIRPNLAADEPYREALGELYRFFEPALEKLRSELREALPAE